jgi:hypothetical protein
LQDAARKDKEIRIFLGSGLRAADPYPLPYLQSFDMDFVGANLVFALHDTGGLIRDEEGLGLG